MPLLCSLVDLCSCLLRSAALAAFSAVPHSLGWSESSPQLWKDATYDVFESRGILPVSDWSQEYCFVGIRESFVAQLLVQGSNWGRGLNV